MCQKDVGVPCEGYFYRVLGVPRPLQRPRFSRNRVYDSQKGEKEEFATLVKAQHVHDGPFTGPLFLEICFYFPIPTYLSRAKMAALPGTFHDKRPDLSNCIKFVEDALNEIIYLDDAQISVICSSKRYSELPRTEFRIIKL